MTKMTIQITLKQTFSLNILILINNKEWTTTIMATKRIRVISKETGHIEEREFQVRDLDHLDAQLKYPHKIEKPKKGKGSSYKRGSKHKVDLKNIQDMEDIV